MTDPHVRHSTLEWQGDFRFLAGGPSGPQVLIDGNSVEGPSPVVTLLLAAGACSGSDVVDILRKGKMEPSRFTLEVSGRRREDYPKRYTEIRMVFRVAGEGITEAKVRRAVDLSIEKYCSVVLSLNPDIPVTTEIVIEPV
ncbi:MAG TPA: OsmC family protein [Gemmatimonadales bacterium]|jgi:putative redox protein|nr:OsmC family protein [Gemmatimonadales bacterium]